MDCKDCVLLLHYEFDKKTGKHSLPRCSIEFRNGDQQPSPCPDKIKMKSFAHSRKERRELMLCGECGKPSTKYRCNNCASSHRASVMKQWNTNPLCRYNRTIYQRRYDNQNKERLALLSSNRREARVQENRCVRCNAPLIESESKYCFACMAGRYQLVLKGALKYETAD